MGLGKDSFFFRKTPVWPIRGAPNQSDFLKRSPYFQGGCQAGMLRLDVNKNECE
jgi:hypothetical protein